MVKSPRARGKRPPLPKANSSRPPTAAVESSTVNTTTSPAPQGPTRKTPTGLPPGVLGNSNFAVIPKRQPPEPEGKGKEREKQGGSSVTAEENPNLHVATPGSGSSSRKDLVFYTNCERAPDEFRRGLPQEYIDLVFSSMAKFCPTLIPTTYEAAEEYLREEKLKPKGKRDLRREFCYLSFTKIQESVGRPTLFLLETQTLIAVGPGHSIAVPTIDCPPWAFDRERNTEPSIFLFDPMSKIPLDATAIMTYFTNTDPNQKHAFDEKETNIIQYKGKMYE